MVKAIQFLNTDEIEQAGSKPGSYAFTVMGSGEVAGMQFICPCGCGHMCYLNLHPDHRSAAWSWNGDEDKPTLTPSIFNTGIPCKWHGYLTDGEFRSC